jgi:hypothetical protein
VVCGKEVVEAPHTAQLDSPAPTIAPQVRHIVGLSELFEFDDLFINTQRLTSVMLLLQSITLEKFGQMGLLTVAYLEHGFATSNVPRVSPFFPTG